MITKPRWLVPAPIAVDGVLAYLIAALDVPVSGSPSATWMRAAQPLQEFPVFFHAPCSHR